MERSSRSQDHSAAGSTKSMQKIPMTQSEIEPATSWTVVHCLKLHSHSHWTTHCLQIIFYTLILSSHLSLLRYPCLMTLVRTCLSLPHPVPPKLLFIHLFLFLLFISTCLFLCFSVAEVPGSLPGLVFFTMSILLSKHFLMCVIHQSLYWRQNPRSRQKINCALPSLALWRKISEQSIKKGTNQIHLYVCTGCFRGNRTYFAKTFLRSSDIDITKNTYIPSLTVTEMMGEKYGLLAVPRIVHVKRDASSLHCADPSLSR